MQTRPKFAETQGKSRYPQRGGPPEAAHPFVEAAGGHLLAFPGVSLYLGFGVRARHIFFGGETGPGIICRFWVPPKADPCLSQHVGK